MEDPELFDLVMGLPATQREAAARGACEGDDARARRMLELVELAAQGEHTETPPDGSESSDSPARRVEGDRIGRYVVTGFLGQGAFGQVYEVRDLELRRQVALKVLRGDRSTDADLQRFRREAQSLAQIDHPNVVRVYDVGEDGGSRWLTMERIDGMSLRAWLEGPGRDVSWRAVLDMLLPAAHGLQAAHAAGIVHRDFKPENVMIERTGRVVVTDFGIARLQGGADAPSLRQETTGDAARPPVTSTASAVGTPRYMAPEQFLGRASPRSDEFAFCRVVVEALSPPGARPDVARVDTQSDGEAERALQGLRGPRWLRAILTRGLSIDEDARFVDMAALVATIERERSWRRWSLRAAVVAAVAVPVVYGVTQRGADPCARWDADVLARELGERWVAIEGAATSATRPEIATAQVAAMRRLVDAGVAELATGRTSVCEQHTRGLVDAATTTARETCFDRWHAETRQHLQWLGEHPEALTSARLVEELPPSPARCRDVAAPSIAQPPVDDETATTLDGLLAEAKTLRIRGDYDGSARAAEAASALVDRVGHLGYRAEVLHRLGVLAARRGAFDRATALLQQAVDAAERSGMDALAAEIHTSVAETLVLAPVADGAWAEAALAVARAKLVRSGTSPALLLADQAAVEGHIAHRAGRYVDAEAAYRSAAAQFDALGVAAAHFAAASRTDLAVAVSAQGRHDEAIAIAEASLADHRAALGEHHPLLAATRHEVGMIYGRAAETASPTDRVAHLQEARAHFLRARELLDVSTDASRVFAAELLAELTRARIGLDAVDELSVEDIDEMVEVLGASTDPRVTATRQLPTLRIARRAYHRIAEWQRALDVTRRAIQLSRTSAHHDALVHHDLVQLVSYEIHLHDRAAAEQHLRELEALPPPATTIYPTYATDLRNLQTASARLATEGTP